MPQSLMRGAQTLCCRRYTAQVAGLRLGVFWPWVEDCSDEVLAACKQALSALRAAGAIVRWSLACYVRTALFTAFLLHFRIQCVGTSRPAARFACASCSNPVCAVALRPCLSPCVRKAARTRAGAMIVDVDLPDLEHARVAHTCIAMCEMLQREQRFLSQHGKRGGSAAGVRMNAETRIVFALARHLTGAHLTQVHPVCPASCCLARATHAARVQPVPPGLLRPGPLCHCCGGPAACDTPC